MKLSPDLKTELAITSPSSVKCMPYPSLLLPIRCKLSQQGDRWAHPTSTGAAKGQKRHKTMERRWKYFLVFLALRSFPAVSHLCIHGLSNITVQLSVLLCSSVSLICMPLFPPKPLTWLLLPPKYFMNLNIFTLIGFEIYESFNTSLYMQNTWGQIGNQWQNWQLPIPKARLIQTKPWVQHLPPMQLTTIPQTSCIRRLFPCCIPKEEHPSEDILVILYISWQGMHSRSWLHLGHAAPHLAPLQHTSGLERFPSLCSPLSRV